MHYFFDRGHSFLVVQYFIEVENLHIVWRRQQQFNLFNLLLRKSVYLLVALLFLLPNSLRKLVVLVDQEPHLAHTCSVPVLLRNSIDV